MKRYKYRWRYLKHIGFTYNGNDDDFLIINIYKSGNISKIYVYDDKDEQIASYEEGNNHTSLCLYELCKIFTIADIAAVMEAGTSFEIDDNYDDLIGISKIHTLDTTYLIIGGYDRWSVLVDINVSQEFIRKNIILSILNYKQEHGFSDAKTMYIRIPKDISSTLDDQIKDKSYVYIV